MAGVIGSGVVLVNVVGGIADMAAFAGVFADGKSEPAWDRFFARVPDAEPDVERRDLLHTVAGMGFDLVYSTTLPATTAADTAAWVQAHGFPAGPVMCREVGDRRYAFEIKNQHCAMVRRERRRASAVGGFIDENTAAVTYLRRGGISAFGFDHLLSLRLTQLREQLQAPAPERVVRKRRRRPKPAETPSSMPEPRQSADKVAAAT
jgi:hypothetical protein